ncbi:MAG: lipopolysaccharide biosynthesis protein [Candidatus Nitrotoga sp.]|nr:lipopolysaccharide biosynthesis protein [Candidatus Nitrotoga sp.]
MSLGQSIRSGAKWLFIGNTGSQALTFIFGIALARLLAPADFGMLVTISIFTGIAGLISGGGMGQALVRAKETTKHDYDIVFTLQIIIGSLIYAGFFFAAPWLAKWYNTPLYTDLLRVSALSFIFRPFVNLPGSILYREMRFKSKAILGIVGLFFTNALAIGMAFMGYGVWSMVISGLLGSLVSAIILIILTGWRPGFNLDWHSGQALVRYGFMVSANDIVVYLRSQSSNFVLSRSLGLTSVGLFNKSDSISNIPLIVVSGSVYDPVFRSIAKSADNADLVKYLYLRSIKLICIYTFPAYLLLYWLAEELIYVLYGVKWAGAAAPLSILAIAGVFMSIGHPAGALLGALNKLRQELVVQLTSFVTVIASLVVGIKYGITGVAWAMVISHAAASFHISLIASRVTGIRFADILCAALPAAYQGSLMLLVFFLVETGSQGMIDSRPLSKVLIYSMTAIAVFILSGVLSPFEVLRQEFSKLLDVAKTRFKIAKKQDHQNS